MNKGEMKRLGDYIREVDVRNRDLEVTKLLDVSISKEFMPSIANTIGTDMSSYKVVEPRQFAYGPVTSRNGDKVSIALYKNDEKAIVSQAYTIFEVKNKQELFPEYLMMWFRRPEFDRYARFKSHGSAREIFSWEEMCDVELPIPSIEQQQKIVSEYDTITHRIRLNEQIIAKLEETAQALYRKMFVDGIDKEHLPEGWRMGTLDDIAEINTDNISAKDNDIKIRYLDSCSVPQNVFDEYQIFNVLQDEIPSRAKRKVKHNDIVYSTVRPNLKHYGIIKDTVENMIVSTAFAVIRSCYSPISNELLYLMLTDEKNTEYLQGIAEMSKATYPSITPEDISSLKITIPIESVSISNMNQSIKYCFDSVYYKHQENKKLQKLQSLLFVKMGQK
ncbi:restriction endonuclease subunit S [Paraprevotella xylaniphila]|uniref:restriction endonuclease subunit S n=1 Tax=Paraprevotella xylaniphila TaxID=454155 RepID=UPI00266DC1B7|nr:restriction endonuclease subunit S [Paraprevotella xylaniphila]